MKRSRAVNIALLAAAMAALEGCGEGQAPAGSYGYRWYNGGSWNGVAVGTHVDPASGTERGVFGGAGDAAGHSGGEAGSGGTGEAAGAGE